MQLDIDSLKIETEQEFEEAKELLGRLYQTELDPEGLELFDILLGLMIEWEEKKKPR